MKWEKLFEPHILNRGYKYRDDCYEQIARDWCTHFGIEIEE